MYAFLTQKRRHHDNTTTTRRQTTTDNHAFLIVVDNHPKMCRVGIEPTTLGLKVRCSTTELPALARHHTLANSAREVSGSNVYPVRNFLQFGLSGRSSSRSSSTSP